MIANKIILGKIIRFLFILGLSAHFLSCSVTKGVPETQSILTGLEIFIDGKKSQDEEILSYIKQKPKKKFMGLKNVKVLYDPAATENSREQLHFYFKNKSYFQNRVTVEEITKKRKTKVIYRVYRGKSYPVSQMDKTGIKDSAIAHLIERFPYENRLREGDAYDYWKIAEERLHIKKLLASKGYFDFNENNIRFVADTLGKNGNVELRYLIHRRISEDSVVSNFKKYTYEDIYIRLIDSKSDAVVKIDTVKYPELTIYLENNKPFPLKKQVITSSLLFKKGDLYNREAIDLTYSKLNNLNVFEQIRINISESSPQNIAIFIELNEQKRYSQTQLLEGIHHTGAFGISGRIELTRRNLFRGGETWGVKLFGSMRGDLNNLGENERFNFFSIHSYGLETDITFPKILSPFNTQKLFPPTSYAKTKVALSFNRFKNPLYGRVESSAYFGYSWKFGKTGHQLNPVQINFIRMDENSDLSGFSGPEIQQNFSNFANPSTSYVFTYNNQNPRKSLDYDYFIGRVEFSGNILRTLGNLTSIFKTTEEGTYTVLGIPFSQYIKLDLDYRHFFKFGTKTELGVRMFTGLGIPYGNSVSLPFNKQYTIGGSNDIRAFPPIVSEPGEYSDNNRLNYSADIKLELNVEYRFAIYESFKGAFFVDAGNVWDLRESRDNEGNLLRPGATFALDNFYTQLYLGTGVGLRFDFDFAVFRVDLGYPLYDPTLGKRNPNYDKNQPGSQEYISLPRSERWIINQPFTTSNVQLNIGIGYPF